MLAKFSVIVLLPSLAMLCVQYASPLLPYALAFAAGAMVFVVADDILPEAQTG